MLVSSLSKHCRCFRFTNRRFVTSISNRSSPLATRYWPRAKGQNFSTSSTEVIDALFQKFDVDKSGFLDYKEMRPLVDSCFQQYDPDHKLSETDYTVIEELLDKDGSSRISMQELRESMNEWFPNMKERGGKKALIVVDMQQDFITGTLPVPGGAEAVGAINALRKRYAFDVVVHTRDSHPADHCSFADNHPDAELFSMRKIPTPAGGQIDQVMWPRHCVKNTPGAEFHPQLVVEASDIVVDKGTDRGVDSYSGFFDNGHGAETKLRKTLTRLKVTDVYVVGVPLQP